VKENVDLSGSSAWIDQYIGLQSLGHFQTFWANDLGNAIFFLGFTFNVVRKSAKPVID